MRRLLLVLALCLAPLSLSAQHARNAPNDIAHGGEKDAHEVAHPVEADGGENEAPKTYFGIPGWMLKLANMILFIGVLGWLIGGPVKKALAERHEQIQRDAEEAKARRAKADALASDIQTRLTQIEQDVRSIHERAAIEGERQKRELIAAAETEAQKILVTARNEVDNRVKHARQELTAYAGELAAQRAEQILRETITEQDRHNLFAESIHEIGEVGS